MKKFDQGLRFVHNPTKSTKRRPFKIRIRMLFVCTRMLLVCYSYVSLRTRMFRVL